MSALGLSGLGQSGKTTAALYLERRYGYTRRHIAETLRAMDAVLLRALGYPNSDISDILEGSRKDGWIIPELGITSRDLQIRTGMFGRNIHADTWVKTWSFGIGPEDRAMNDSVRFPNEEAAIRDLHGFTILIERPGTQPAAFKWGWLGRCLYERLGWMCGVHDSERIDRLNPTYRIVNSGSRADLYARLDAIMAEQGIAPRAGP